MTRATRSPAGFISTSSPTARGAKSAASWRSSNKKSYTGRVKKLNSIGVGSVFRLSLMLGAVAGLLVGFVLMVTDFIDRRFLEGAVTLVLAPVLYGVLGALVNALMAWIYNQAAARIGGIEISFED